MTQATACIARPPRYAPISLARAPILLAELDPLDVLADLLGSGDFPAEVLDPERAAEIIIERLNDAGFLVVSSPRGRIDPLS